MAIKRNPLFIRYTKLAMFVRKDVKDLTDYNYTLPITHTTIKSRIANIKEHLNEMSKILDAIKKEKDGPQLSAAPKKKTLSAQEYKRPAFDLPTTGTYIFKTPKKDYILESWLFERENRTEDSLVIQDELRGELGSIIIKNNAWRNLANGKTIQARASKGQKGKLTKLK
jgi:hypothetical protein